MSGLFENFDAHAYVDDSLDPARRLTFEAELRRDAKLRARVTAWENQKEAIRIAFGGSARAPRSISPPIRCLSEIRAKSPVVGSGDAPRPAFANMRLSTPRSAYWSTAVQYLLGIFVVVASLFCSAGARFDPRSVMITRAATELRIAPSLAEVKLDVASSDPDLISAWLGKHVARFDARRLVSAGWSLLGIRFVSGTNAAAALVLLENAIGTRAALLVEPTDGLGTLPARAERRGEMLGFAGVEDRVSYAIVGPNGSNVQSLVTVLDAHPGP